MSIASRINKITGHICDAYNVLEVAGADLTNIDKNILNLKSTWQERLLYFMNNGTQQVWDNWDKVEGTGETLTLNNTEEAPMSLVYKGNTYQANAILPSTYTQVEYIESTGGQFIDTGFAITTLGQVYKAILDTQYTSAISGNAILISTNVDAWMGQSGGYYAIGSSFKSNTPATERHIIEVSYGKQTTLKVNNETITRTVYNAVGNVILFAGSNPDAYLSKAKLYSCKIYNSSNILVRDFIPCYRNSDNVIGLYDLVGNQFYTNTGTGTFTKGSNTTLPNPDYPQPIQVVSGDNSIEVVGKNILNLEDNTRTFSGLTITTTNNKVRITGTGATNINSQIVNFELKAGTYTFSATNNDYNFFVLLRDANNKTIKSIFISGKSQTITLNQETKKIAYGVEYLTSSSTYDITTYFQIEKGSTATSYEPYQSQTYPIYLGVENILPSELSIINAYLNSDGTTTPANDWKCIETYVEVKPSTTYKASCSNMGARFIYCEYDSSKQVIGTTTENTTGIITTSSTTKYVRFCTNNSTATDFQLELGNKQNHISTTPIELLKIVTYQDKIFKNIPNTTDYNSELEDNLWYVKKEIGKVVLDGSETGWLLDKTGTYGDILDIRYSDIGIDNLIKKGTGTTQSPRIPRISDYFSYFNTPSSYKNCPVGNLGFNSYGSNDIFLIFCVESGKFANVSGWTNWLRSNNVEVRYVLATPTYTLIEDTTLIKQLETIKKSYEGQTNISQENNDMPFIIKAEALTEF